MMRIHKFGKFHTHIVYRPFDGRNRPLRAVLLSGLP